MRTLVIGILALLAGGCAARDFNLVPRDPEAPWQVAHHWVRMESSQATVNMAFDGIEYGHLVFDVEVVNQTDSTLRIDPTQFSYTLASSGEDLPRNLQQRFPALAPEEVQNKLRKGMNPGGGSGLLALVATTVVIAAVVADAVEFDGALSSAASTALDSWSGPEGCVQSQAPAPCPAFQQPDPSATADPGPPVDPVHVVKAKMQQLLRPTDLAPGAKVRGEIWLPGRPVQKAIGPEEMDNDPSITARKHHGPVFRGLTLRTPAGIGAQELDYSIAVD